MEKIVLAYSGGLDTSVAIPWLKEKYGFEVVTLTADLGGQDRDLADIKAKALKTGATSAHVLNARHLFVKYFVFPALRAGALYEGSYPLATALARPLIAKLLVDVARKEGAKAIAHGCTGKGNDQVRFDVATATLAPDLKVVAPAREWRMTREETMDYASAHGIPVSTTVRSPYSTDDNLWGRSIECGVLEDPWVEPPEDIYLWTRNPSTAPDAPAYVEVTFTSGVPVALDGKGLDGVSLIYKLNELAGLHAVGRVDHVENRVIGIKSREIYEAPAATVLHAAHQSLEDLTLTKDAARLKARISIEYADLIYNGLWFSPYHQDLAACIASSQRYVNGTVRVKLWKGNCTVVGREADGSLYSKGLATYDKGDLFDPRHAEGFIALWGLPLRTQAEAQGLDIAPPESTIIPPSLEE